MRSRRLAFLGAAVATVAAVATFEASAQSTTQVGTLSCDVSAGIGMILTQQQTLNCLFTSAHGGAPEPYYGRIDKFGVALGAVEHGQLVWLVFAPASGLPHGALAGTYAGLGAEATAGVGLGANALYGGTGRAFSLQPYSLQGQVGLNIAGGVTTVTLMPAPPLPPSK
jgi:hypothetical protein